MPSFAPGERLGPYEILSPLGAGGMGKVYKARDTRLDRLVAVKTSQVKFSDRFEREARAISALNHPHICHLYDVGPDYLVMELVEGPTLADRIRQGPLPLDETLEIARQIAEALEAAHEKGITHRDLKPGNIKVRPDGTVKVLDFGLAKMGGTPTATTVDSPTISMTETQAGVILGTAAYMSPEQAKGKAVDQRADIYAFGVVLYEMVTGARLHTGETTTEVLASVIKEAPDWSKVPHPIRRLLRRCLEKDPQKRQRHIGDVMGLVDEAGEVPADANSLRRRLAWPLAGLFLLTTFALGVLYIREPQPASPPLTRFQIPLPDKTTAGTFAISPDGRRLVFQTAGGPGSSSQLWIRSLDSLEWHPLPDTEGANVLPFWSPDSRYIAFSSEGKLKRVDATGGPAQTICDLGSAGFAGGAWNRDGVILFGSRAGILRVPAGGGTPSAVTSLDRSRAEGLHATPFFLADETHFLYFGGSSQPGNSGVYAGSVDARPKDQPHKQLVVTTSTPVYAGGHLLFLRDGTLIAQSLDPKRLELTGDPIPVAENIGTFAPAPVGLFTASENGVLIDRGGTARASLQLTWFGRDGKVLGVAGEPEPYVNVVLSPDSTRASATWDGDLWVVDLLRGSSSRLTTSKAVSGGGIWSPDGSRVAYGIINNEFFGIYQQAANGAGAPELLWKGPQQTPGVYHSSSDGRFLLLAVQDPKTSTDVWALRLKDRKAFPVVQSEFQELGARFSPDAHWVAYISNKSGANEIYVRPFDPDAPGAATTAPEFLVSKGGSVGMPRWRSDGRELYYLTADGKIMAVDVTTPQHPGEPKLLFQAATGFIRSFRPGALGDVTPDGKRFLLAVPVNRGNSEAALKVVLNWTEALKKK